MPEFIPSMSDFLKFKKLRIIQDSNGTLSSTNKIPKTNDSEQQIKNIYTKIFPYQKGVPTVSAFDRCYGTYSVGTVTYVSSMHIEWNPIPNSAYYKVFLTRYGTDVEKNTINLTTPTGGSAGLPFFSYDSGPLQSRSIDITLTESNDTTRGNHSVGVYVFGYSVNNIRSEYPLTFLSYSTRGPTPKLYLDRSAYVDSSVQFVSYFLDDNSEVNNQGQAVLKQKLLTLL